MSTSQRFDLPSGAKLAVTPADFRDAWKLTQIRLKILRDFGGLMRGDKKGDEFAFEQMVGLFTSGDLDAQTFACAKRSLYIPAEAPEGHPGIPVNPALFDDADVGEAARGDYPVIVTKILEVNCKPFLAHLLSVSEGIPGTGTGSPKSSAT